MFALFAPICLCGSALTSTWAGREAEYAKQLEQRLITLELPRRKMVDFLDFFAPAKQTGSPSAGKDGTQLSLSFDCFRVLI